jgi:hypothetical protein
MTTVDPSATLVHLLQRQITSVAGKRAVARGQSPATAAATPSKLASLAAERIRSIRPDDPERRSKALRVFLECVMQQAFGAQAVHDPNFAPMLDTVQQQMRDDPKIAEAAEALARVLVGEAKV